MASRDDGPGSSPAPAPAGERQPPAPPTHEQELGRRLRTLRKWCGASRHGLAKASGISVYTLRRYEEGRAAAPLLQLHRIAQALKASLVYLHSGMNPPSEADVAEMRLWWKLNQVSPEQATTVLKLIDGILSQLPRRRSAAGG